MQNTNLNDFIVDILQDFCEIESMMKVLKNAINNENDGITMTDVENTLEIIVAKISNSTGSLHKYIDDTFE